MKSIVKNGNCYLTCLLDLHLVHYVFQLVCRDLATLSLSAIFLFLFPLVSVPIFSLSNQVLDA